VLDHLGTQSGGHPGAVVHQLLQAVDGGQGDSTRGATVGTAAAKLHGSAAECLKSVLCLMLGSDCMHALMHKPPGWITLLLLLVQGEAIEGQYHSLPGWTPLTCCKGMWGSGGPMEVPAVDVSEVRGKHRP